MLKATNPGSGYFSPTLILKSKMPNYALSNLWKYEFSLWGPRLNVQLQTYLLHKELEEPLSNGKNGPL